MMERKNVWKSYAAEQADELNQINEKYKWCLDVGKTERECVKLAIDMLVKEGYRNISLLLFPLPSNSHRIEVDGFQKEDLISPLQLRYLPFSPTASPPNSLANP